MNIKTIKINNLDQNIEFQRGFILVDNKFLSEIDREPITDKVKFLTFSPTEAKVCDDSDLYDLLCFFERHDETHDITAIIIE